MPKVKVGRDRISVRKAHWDDSGTITLEVKHPVYGWIPFTASPTDSEEHGRLLHAAGVRGDYPVAGTAPVSEQNR